ncbi:MerR family transcriptional regulator [Desulfobulbus alkaliphilus]|uniref:MerR family transcriptional regulator n=1 Tax=Desulfobulbus alkaliphilus TaxID=869814 RepID=UPI00196537D7|nr:MerR family transcriptional regulator [Desulfobulbus alkaliphilus]
MKQHSASDPQQIPDKVYFRIGEASRLVGVDTHVLRYWETEFPKIKPFRGKSKQRLYRRQDIETLLLIKTLLHDEGYTIAGARKFLASYVRGTTQRTSSSMGHHPSGTDANHLVVDIKNELQSIMTLLQERNNDETSGRG